MYSSVNIMKPDPPSYYSLSMQLKDVKYKQINSKIVNYTLQGYVRTLNFTTKAI